jgi:hypothetical protein
MNPIKIPQETINLIFGQLNGTGDPQQLGKGYKYEKSIQAQIEVPNEYAARDLRPTLFHYTAEVVEKNDALEWEIKNIVLVGSEGIKLLW